MCDYYYGLTANKKDQVAIISRLIDNKHDLLKTFATQLQISIRGSKVELLIRMADFLLTETGLKIARAKLPSKLVNMIYE